MIADIVIDIWPSYDDCQLNISSTIIIRSVIEDIHCRLTWLVSVLLLALVALFETRSSHASSLCHCCGYKYAPRHPLTVQTGFLQETQSPDVATRSGILHAVNGNHCRAKASNTVGSSLLPPHPAEAGRSTAVSHRHRTLALTWTLRSRDLHVACRISRILLEAPHSKNT